MSPPLVVVGSNITEAGNRKRRSDGCCDGTASMAARSSERRRSGTSPGLLAGGSDGARRAASQSPRPGDDEQASQQPQQHALALNKDCSPRSRPLSYHHRLVHRPSSYSRSRRPRTGSPAVPCGSQRGADPPLLPRAISTAGTGSRSSTLLAGGPPAHVRLSGLKFFTTDSRGPKWRAAAQRFQPQQLRRREPPPPLSPVQGVERYSFASA